LEIETEIASHDAAFFCHPERLVGEQ